MVGLRDGLVELGYREDEDFALSIRFMPGELTALPAAAHGHSGKDVLGR